MVQNFAEGHNAGLWRCLARILPASTGADPIAKAIASLPVSMGGLGLRDASHTSEPAFWASWADCLSMTRKRHPEVALEIVCQVNGVDACPSLHAASRVARELTGVEGFEPPTWDALANRLRPPTHDADEFEPGANGGWQHEAASRVERQFRIRLMGTHGRACAGFASLAEWAHGWNGPHRESIKFLDSH